MDSALEAYMKEKMGVSWRELCDKTEREKDVFYEKAMALEEIAAVAAGEEPSEELELAADLVDFLHDNL